MIGLGMAFDIHGCDRGGNRRIYKFLGHKDVVSSLSSNYDWALAASVYSRAYSEKA